jgi:hypothetical protein
MTLVRLHIKKRRFIRTASFLIFNFLQYYLIASDNSAPALNFATFLAAILILAFVAGLIPSRAGRSLTLNVPKPTSCTLSPATRASLIAATVASNAFFESAFVSPEPAAILSINSVLFIIFDLLNEYLLLYIAISHSKKELGITFWAQFKCRMLYFRSQI